MPSACCAKNAAALFLAFWITAHHLLLAGMHFSFVISIIKTPDYRACLGCSLVVPLVILFYQVGSHRVTPFNVTVKELSSSSALVTWSLFADESPPVSSNHTADSAQQPFRLEITYRPYRQRLQTSWIDPRHFQTLDVFVFYRQRMIIAVPADVTSYILSDLR